MARSDANAIASTFGAQSFNGYAVYTEEKKFQKVELTDIDKGKADFAKQGSDGWLAYVQHYFVSAWLPEAKVAREYAVEKRADGAVSEKKVLPVRFVPLVPGK